VYLYTLQLCTDHGHVCAQVEPLPWQQTMPKTIWQQPLPPSMSTHLPSKHCLITMLPTHYINTPSCPVSCCSQGGNGVCSWPQPAARCPMNKWWRQTQGNNDGDNTCCCHHLGSSSVPIQVSLHKYSPPFPCLTLNPGAMLLSVMWQPNDDTTNVIVHCHRTNNTQPMSLFIVIGLTTHNLTNNRANAADHDQSLPVWLWSLCSLVLVGTSCPSWGSNNNTRNYYHLKSMYL